MPDFLYKTSFESSFAAIPISEDSFVSKASLDNLKSLIPQGIDYQENIDLIGLAFNAAVINQFNKNGDGLNSENAVKIVKNFIHKPTNIEHDKSKIVGHIASAGFSEYDNESQLLSIDEVAAMTSPYNVALGSVLYRYANKPFTNLILRSLDPEDSLYQKISTSWEVGFNAFNIAIGSVNLKDAELVTDEKHIKELKKYLKAYGGAGALKDGTKIYRLLQGDLYPLGIGFTSNPAADVQGLFSNEEYLSEKEIKDKEDKKIYFDIKKFNFNKKSLAAISQIQISSVKPKKEITMDIEKMLLELKDLLIEKKFSEEVVASMTDTFANAIRQKDTEYRESLTAAETEKVNAVKEREELKASVSDLQTQLQSAVQKINEFEDFKKQEEALARFNGRMEVLDSEYNLDDEDRKVLAEDLKGLDDSEESFASYKTKMAVMWRHKNKEAQASLEKQIQDRIDEEVAKKMQEQSVSTASVKEKASVEDLEDAFEKAKASQAALPSSNEDSSRQPQSLREKFAAAFNRENVIIS